MERRLKHWFLPKIRGRMHQTRPSTLFSPIFSLAREKIGPPEARQKRPRRNEPPQATSLILWARFFLSKPQTEFAVWVFLCKSATTSQSRLRRASSPFRGAKVAFSTVDFRYRIEKNAGHSRAVRMPIMMIPAVVTAGRPPSAH